MFNFICLAVFIWGVIDFFSALYGLCVIVPIAILSKLFVKPRQFGYPPEVLRKMDENRRKKDLDENGIPYLVLFLFLKSYF